MFSIVQFGISVEELLSVSPVILATVLSFHVAPGSYRPDAGLGSGTETLPSALLVNDVTLEGVCTDAVGL